MIEKACNQYVEHTPAALPNQYQAQGAGILWGEVNYLLFVELLGYTGEMH